MILYYIFWLLVGWEAAEHLSPPQATWFPYPCTVVQLREALHTSPNAIFIKRCEAEKAAERETTK